MNYTLHQGESLALLPTLGTDSVDALVVEEEDVLVFRGAPAYERGAP